MKQSEALQFNHQSQPSQLVSRFSFSVLLLLHYFFSYELNYSTARNWLHHVRFHRWNGKKRISHRNSYNLLSLTKITAISWFAAEAIILSFNSTKAKRKCWGMRWKTVSRRKIAASTWTHIEKRGTSFLLLLKSIFNSHSFLCWSFVLILLEIPQLNNLPSSCLPCLFTSFSLHCGNN